ncbi:MAG: alpha/beta hydrolase [Hyphomicrobiaceae bacterium]
MSTEPDLFKGFEAITIDVGSVTIFARTGGNGPPLLLLHGYPQTHACWHKLAPALARNHTVVVPDLRGYGRSSCPPSDATHRAYAKRTMANDMLQLMAKQGFARFAVMGHDRGARVAYRLTLDYPDAVSRLAIVDIISTLDQWRPEHQTTRDRIHHWAFMAQPAPLPETLIAANARDWIEARLKRGARGNVLTGFDPAALDDYVRSHADPDRIHAACEDYRAGATCDLADDRKDFDASNKIVVPTLVAWGSVGSLADIADPLAVWRPWCTNLFGARIESGHYIPEDNPDALLAYAESIFKP